MAFKQLFFALQSRFASKLYIVIDRYIHSFVQYECEDKYRLHAERMQNKGNRIAYSYILTSIHKAAPVIAGSGFFLP